MAVKTALRSLILSGDVSAKVSQRVFQDFAAVSEPKLPYITFQQIGSPAFRHMAGRSDLAQSTFQIDVWAQTTVEREAIGTALRDTLDGFDGTVAAVPMHVFLENRGRDLVEERAINGRASPVFRKSLDATIWYAI